MTTHSDRIDISTPAALLERARYLTVMFGFGRSRWRFDRWAMELLESRGASDHMRRTLTEELQPATVERFLMLPSQPPGGCDGGGNIHLGHDSDYPCGGCGRCRPREAGIGYAIGAFAWQAATWVERSRLATGIAGLRGLAAIGAAIEAALSPGRAVATFLRASVEEWLQVREGRWYRVAGRRGRAKEHVGAEGEVVRLEQAPGRFGRAAGTLRAAIRPEGASKWIWVPASALEPIATPSTVQAAKAAAEEERALRADLPEFAGDRGAPVYVIGGPHAGRSGVVFWRGVTRGAVRLGVRWGAGHEDVVWCAVDEVCHAADLAAATKVLAAPLTSAQHALLAAISSGDAAARLVLADSLEEAGATSLSQAWRAPIPTSSPAREGWHRARAMRDGGATRGHARR